MKLVRCEKSQWSASEVGKRRKGVCSRCFVKRVTLQAVEGGWGEVRSESE